MGRDPKWEQFAELMARCYKAAENGNTLNVCWHDAFDALMRIIEAKRGTDSSYARELGDMEKYVQAVTGLSVILTGMLNHAVMTKKALLTKKEK